MNPLNTGEVDGSRLTAGTDCLQFEGSKSTHVKDVLTGLSSNLPPLKRSPVHWRQFNDEADGPAVDAMGSINIEFWSLQ